MSTHPMLRHVTALLFFCLACGGSKTPLPIAPGSSAEPGSPLIVVSETSVTLDGTAINDALLAEKEARQVHLMDLSSRLKERGESWKRENAGSSPPTDQWFDVRPGAPTLTALSALNTAAVDGYTKIHLKTKSGWLDGLYDVPTLRAASDAIHVRVVAQVDREGFALSWQSDASCDLVPQDVRVQSAAELGAYLDKSCSSMAAPCVDAAQVVVFGSPVTFAGAIALRCSRTRQRPSMILKSMHAF